MTRTRMRIAAVMTAAFMILTLAAPAMAQVPTQRGLVNVNVSDVVVQAPIALAANLCDVAVNVLAVQRRTGGAECDAAATSDAVFTDDEGPAPRQRGLVNVNVSDVTVQLPVSVAANVCDVAVNVLARQNRQGGAVCDAVAESTIP